MEKTSLLRCDRRFSAFPDEPVPTLKPARATSIISLVSVQRKICLRDCTLSDSRLSQQLAAIANERKRWKTIQRSGKARLQTREPQFRKCAVLLIINFAGTATRSFLWPMRNVCLLHSLPTGQERNGRTNERTNERTNDDDSSSPPRSLLRSSRDRVR